MDIKGLKIQNVISHIDDVCIDRSVFDLDRVNFYINGNVKVLKNVEVSKGLYIQDVPVSKEAYIRFICPVCYVQADVGCKEEYINGVIRPDIHIVENIPVVSRNSAQRFHFYYENPDEKLLGISSHYTKIPVVAQLIEWNINDYEKFKQEFIINPQSRVPAEFEVNINKTYQGIRKYSSFFPGKMPKSKIKI